MIAMGLATDRLSGRRTRVFLSQDGRARGQSQESKDGSSHDGGSHATGRQLEKVIEEAIEQNNPGRAATSLEHALFILAEEDSFPGPWPLVFLPAFLILRILHRARPCKSF